MLTFLKVKGYSLGMIPRPDPVLNLESNEVWIHNDSYILSLLTYLEAKRYTLADEIHQNLHGLHLPTFMRLKTMIPLLHGSKVFFRQLPKKEGTYLNMSGNY